MRPWLLLVLLLPTAAAQGGLMLLEGETEATVTPGGSVELTWVVAATDGQDHFVLAELDLGDAQGWEAVVDPPFVNVDAGQTEAFTVTVTPSGDPRPRELHVVLLLQDHSAAGTVDSAQTGIVHAEGFGLVLGRYENPLPAPLHGTTGTFLLNLLAWLGIAAAAMWLVSPTLKVLTTRTRSDLDDRVIHIVSRPLFVGLFAYGTVQSIAVFPLPPALLRALQTAWSVLLIALLVYVAYRLWHEVIRSVGRRFAKRTESDLDDKLFPVFDKVGGIVILLAGLFFILDGFGINMAFFAAGGAVVSLVIAFAAQDTLGNLFAGIFILLDRPFREGDRIEIQELGTWGDVVEIGLRTTRIRTRDNRMVVVPNSTIGSNPVVNHSYPDALYRVETHVGIAYGSDIEKARHEMVEAVKEVEGIRKDLPIEALFVEFGDSALLFRIRWWLASYEDTRRIFDSVHTALDRRLRLADVEIPFPQRVLWYGDKPQGDDVAPAASAD